MPPVELPYTEIVPPADLAPYVDRLWLRTTLRGSGGIQRILPDGCVDVIIHADRGTAELVGTMTRALQLADGPAHLVAARFRPGTAAALAHCSLAELTDRTPDLADLGIASPAGRITDAQLADRGIDPDPRRADHGLTSTAGRDPRIAALITWLRARLADAPPPDPLITHAVSLLSSGARVDHVADQLGVSRQYLARRFHRDVGITPKQLSRIARMQRAAAILGGRSGTAPQPAGRCARLASSPASVSASLSLWASDRVDQVRRADPSGRGDAVDSAHTTNRAAPRRGDDLARRDGLARLAVELGYFDQAHLANELRSLVGLTPAALATERPLALSHLFG